MLSCEGKLSASSKLRGPIRDTSPIAQYLLEIVSQRGSRTSFTLIFMWYHAEVSLRYLLGGGGHVTPQLGPRQANSQSQKSPIHLQGLDCRYPPNPMFCSCWIAQFPGLRIAEPGFLCLSNLWSDGALVHPIFCSAWIGGLSPSPMLYRDAVFYNPWSADIPQDHMSGGGNFLPKFMPISFFRRVSRF